MHRVQADMHPTLATLMVAHDAAELGDWSQRWRLLDELIDCRWTRYEYSRRVAKGAGRWLRVEGQHHGDSPPWWHTPNWHTWPEQRARWSGEYAISPGGALIPAGDYQAIGMRLHAGESIAVGAMVSMDSDGRVRVAGAMRPIGFALTAAPIGGLVDVDTQSKYWSRSKP